MKRFRRKSTLRTTAERFGALLKTVCIIFLLALYPAGVTFAGVCELEEPHTDGVAMAQTEQRLQALVVSGTVRDRTGKPVVGAGVMQKGTQNGTVTDANGAFSLTLPRSSGQITLVVQFLGYETKEVAVSGGEPVNIVLEESAYAIEKLVVSTGIFDKPRESFVGSVTSISADDIRSTYSRNMVQTIAMNDPSFRIVENNFLGSNPNNLPEIQLRGASSFRDITDLQSGSGSNVNLPLFIYDGFEISLERFMDLNEDDVESIVILKDASATAMYGSRGANGVIVIKPVAPRAGEIRVTYRGEMNLEIPKLDSYNMLNAKEKLQVELAAGIWDGHLNEYQRLYDRVNSEGLTTDWLEEPTRVGVGQTHRLNILGGTNVFRVLANISYKDIEGAMKESFRKSFNATLTLGYTYKNLYITNLFNVNTLKAQESPYGNYAAIAKLNPYWTLKDDDGQWNTVFYHPAHVDEQGDMLPIHNNVYNATLGNYLRSDKDAIENNLQARWHLWDGFRVEGRFTVTHQDKRTYAYGSPADTRNEGVTKQARGMQKETYLEGALTLVYGKQFDKHLINAGVSSRVSGKDAEYGVYRANGYEFMSDELYDLFPGSVFYNKKSELTPVESIRRSVELIGTVNYIYDSRYFVDGMIRFDGGSTFGRHSRWKEFFSIGTGWNISSERFMENATFVDLLRVKYSYGRSGGINFSPDQGNHVYEYQATDPYFDLVGATLKRYGNTNLSWQTTYTHNVGLDFELFNRRVEGELAYYNQQTSNAIMQMSFSPSHGFANFTGNSGRVRNEGWEAKLSWYAMRNENWLVKAVGYFSRNKNTVLELSREMKNMIAIMEKDNQIGNTYRYTYREGSSMDAIYVLRSIGIDPMTGKRIYVNAQGHTQFTNNGLGDALVYAGDRQPKVNGLVSAVVSYKNLMVTVGMQFQFGGHELNQTLLDKVENIDWSQNVDRRVYSDRWRKQGDKTIYKGLTDTSLTYANTEFVQKNDSFSWTYLNVSYDMPRRFLDKVMGGIERLNVSANVSDIFHRGTMRRERGLEYPYSVQTNFSISLTF